MKAMDPVCGMKIEDTDAAPSSEYRGKKYYFCSQACKSKFDQNPEAFVADKQDKKEGGGPAVAPEATMYTCPMHPEVRQPEPGFCPKCGMALEPVMPPVADKTEWTCPMHPEIIRDAPGACPICGMALEPRTAVPGEEENPELIDMSRRFRVSAVLTVPLVLIAMRSYVPGLAFEDIIPAAILKWSELILATPVVLWGGWPFFVRGWRSIINRSPNMFTLIGLGTGIAYIYSLVAALLPGIFPESFQDENGDVGTYFEAAAVIVTLVLLGQVLELKARSKTGAAIKALLGLAPKQPGVFPAAWKKTFRSNTFNLETSCGCVPARRSRLTGSCRRGTARWTNRWLPVNPSPLKRESATVSSVLRSMVRGR